MAPRSIWNGTVTFGLVNMPMKLYSATESKSIHFNEVHVRDGARVQHKRICPKDEKEVPQKEVTKGYEVSEGKFVVLEPEEIKAAAGDRGKVIHLEEFVDAHDVDPVFFDKTYYVGARDDADTYRLIHEALKRSERAGIGRFTFHDREYLVALRARDDVLILHTLRFDDEVVSGKELDVKRPSKRPAQNEVAMAGKLVDSLARPFDPEDYEDSYREAVLGLIKRKAKGEEIDLAEQEEPEQGDDLLAALKASVG